jgi:hypothetical protein
VQLFEGLSQSSPFPKFTPGLSRLIQLLGRDGLAFLRPKRSAQGSWVLNRTRYPVLSHYLVMSLHLVMSLQSRHVW